MAQEMRMLARKARRTNQEELYHKAAKKIIWTAIREFDLSGLYSLLVYLRARFLTGIKTDTAQDKVPEKDQLQPEDILGSTCTIANIVAPPASPRDRRGRLFRSYFLLVLGLVCVAVLVSGGVTLFFSFRHHQAILGELQQEKARTAALEIGHFVREIEQQLSFAALPLSGEGAEGIAQRRLEFIKLLRQVPAVSDVAQLDPRGAELLTVSRLGRDVAGSRKDRSRDPAFLGAQPGRTWYGPVYFRKETEPYMAIALRQPGAEGEVTAAEVNLKFIWDVVSQIRAGKRGKAYVVDRSGRLIADPDIALVLARTDVSGLAKVNSRNESASD